MRHVSTRFLAAAGAILFLASPALPADDEPRSVSSGRLLRNPDDYYGDHVRVRGQIARVYDRRAFTLDEDHPLVRHDLLVIAPRPLVRVRPGAEVVISGYVRRLDASDLRRDYPWFRDAVPGEALEDADDRPVVVAEAIVLRSLGGDRNRDIDDEDFEEDDDRVRKSRSRVDKSESRFTLREDDWEAAGLVAGRSVVLSDARVLERLGRHTFVVRDDDDREIVVRMDRARMVPAEGDRVDISGVVRRIPTDIDTWDLDSDSARRRVRAKSLFVEARQIAR